MSSSIHIMGLPMSHGAARPAEGPGARNVGPAVRMVAGAAAREEDRENWGEASTMSFQRTSDTGSLQLEAEPAVRVEVEPGAHQHLHYDAASLSTNYQTLGAGSSAGSHGRPLVSQGQLAGYPSMNLHEVMHGWHNSAAPHHHPSVAGVFAAPQAASAPFTGYPVDGGVAMRSSDPHRVAYPAPGVMSMSALGTAGRPQVFGDNPVEATCPCCHHTGFTSVRYTPGTMAIVVCIFCTVCFGLPICCILTPCCGTAQLDKQHRCSRCSYFFGGSQGGSMGYNRQGSAHAGHHGMSNLHARHVHTYI
mmetsp:Transcript_1222/g.2545  ORF Transcript_1222/g.2545 Transcript_1222/m.2545 type:complete len:305 (+) Transcript_1222:186-1100(+)